MFGRLPQKEGANTLPRFNNEPRNLLTVALWN